MLSSTLPNKKRQRQRTVRRGRRWPVGTIMPDDTRDRLTALEVEVKHLVGMVEKNSSILADLHGAHLKAQGGWLVGKLMMGSMKMLGSGGAGAGLLAVLQHWAAVPMR